MMALTETRKRMANAIYTTLEPHNALGLLQQALSLSDAAEPLERRIRVEGIKTGRVTALNLPQQIEEALEIGLVTEAEANVLREYDQKVMELINVDDFDPRDLSPHPEQTAANMPLDELLKSL
jgi:acyl-CoA dehydrogenase